VDLSWLYFAMIFPLLFGMILRDGYLIALVYSFLIRREKSDRYSTIYLIRQEKQTSFFNKNKERIYLIIITAIITAIVTAFFSKVFGINP
jgi:vacuolar-type H+-ATPase subunit I/STV1